MIKSFLNNYKMSVDIKTLSAEDRAALLADLQKEQEAEQEQKKQERERYKELTNATVTESIKRLMNMSSELSQLKASIFNSFATLLQMKAELFGIKEGQQSHDFTNKDGMTISIGSRIIEGWDDTVESGISIVNKYLEGLATDDKSAKLVNMIYRLLKKDAKGNLKGNRVLELQKLADELDDTTFTEGVNIIRTAYRPFRSAFFIEAYCKDNMGKKQSVPLSITSVDFPEGVEVDTSLL
jgi:hypothetical protein